MIPLIGCPTPVYGGDANEEEADSADEDCADDYVFGFEGGEYKTGVWHAGDAGLEAEMIVKVVGDSMLWIVGG